MASGQTIELAVHVSDEWHELLVADLADLGFDVFDSGDGVVRAYIQADRWSDESRRVVTAWLHSRGLAERVAEIVHEAKNWNQAWERSLQPLTVEPFLIKPSWAAFSPEHEKLIVLEIDPKMSFGTGHHESTRLALRSLADLVRPGMRVLDVGTGTGVLAIAAARMGAATVLAFDDDEWSYVNASENCLINGVGDVVTVRRGSLEVVEQRPFDLILANINLHVILAMLSGFGSRLSSDGALVLSGLLCGDRETVLTEASSEGLLPKSERVEGDWWSAVLVWNNH